MQKKNVLYAAVGAPIVAARKMGDRLDALREKAASRRTGYAETAEKTISGWADEGEKAVSRLSEGKVVEEISSKVDLDQAKEQVGRLRDQLEDMLDTWRTSFRPEGTTDPAEPAAKSATPKKPAAKKPAAKKPASGKPAAKKASAASKGGSQKTGSGAKKSSSTTGSAAKAS